MGIRVLELMVWGLGVFSLGCECWSGFGKSGL